MTKQMRKLGVQFHNRRNDDMFKVEGGVVYKLLPGNCWLRLWISEDELLADGDVYYLNGGRNLAAVMFAVVCVALGLELWGWL